VDTERYWQAVLDRDQTADTDFVYAVRSTGIYCRPSCPSRRPRRVQVVFFNQPAAAQAAGYRACRRCRPDDEVPAVGRARLIAEICRRLDETVEEAPNLAKLSHQLGLSRSTLQRRFRQATGLTLQQYAGAARLNQLKQHLRQGESVTTALYAAGYGSSSRLYEQADRQLGMTPATYGRGGRGACIGYAIVASPVGRLLVAATERGLCRVSLGDDAAELLNELRTEYPAATIEPATTLLAPWTAKLMDYLAGQHSALALPLDIQATAFQGRVWQALRAIPYGETRSYAAVAAAIDQPTATRAVAQACASNPVALVIPCHRVVQSNGGLGGYRWGSERKAHLLAGERRSG
jgi:AraC family transcriptional regulator of adaptative response/methylated-DNA-[protein]-cysteine methyltransferase